MASWTTSAKVTRYLPTNYASGLTTSIANLIVEASNTAHGDLSPRYWPFPDATDTPATEEIVQNVVAYLAAHLARLELGRSNELELVDDTTPNNLLALYHDRIRRLMSDDDEMRSQVPLTIVSDEAMTFGTDPLDDHEYRLNPGDLDLEGFEVIPESCRISGYEYGRDFSVNFHREHRGWLLSRHTSLIVDTTEVTYAVDWLRRREVTRAETRYGIELVRG